MSPILKYTGGKRSEIKYFKNYLPNTFNCYFEPFFGGGAVYFYIMPKKALISDINAKLIKFYQDFSKNYLAIKNELTNLNIKYNENTPGENNNLYYLMRSYFNNQNYSKYHYGTIYYFLNKLAYGGMIRYNNKNKFNVPYGWYKKFSTKEINQKHYDLLKSATILKQDYLRAFKLANQNKDNFIFLDPPYDTTFTSYGNKAVFNKNSQIKLAQNFKQLKCKALLVINKTPLTTALYQNYIKNSYHKNYMTNIRNRYKSKATHLIITNY